MTVYIHVECLQGTGELTQARRVAQALLDKGEKVTVFTHSGLPYFYDLQDKLKDTEAHARLSIIPLPAISYDKPSGRYLVGQPLSEAQVPLHDERGGYSSAGYTQLKKRYTAITNAYETEPGPVVSMSGWPFWLGDGILDMEMQRLLTASNAHHQPMSILTRDVLHPDSPPMKEGVHGLKTLFANHPNLHWGVLGDPKLIAIEREFLDAIGVRPARVRYLGFGETCSGKRAEGIPNHLVVAPGGGDYRISSFNVLRLALEAATRPEFADKEWTCIVGRNFPDEAKDALKELAEQASAAGAKVKLVSQLQAQEYQELLAKEGTLLIAQAGIGTMNDIILHNLPTLFVPIETTVTSKGIDGQRHNYQFDEQMVRAGKLAKKKLVACLTNKDINTDLNQPLPPDTDELVDIFSAKINAAMQLKPDFSQYMNGGFTQAASFVASPTQWRKPSGAKGIIF